MSLFLSDLWADLREKRLWPVAAALVAGLVAVPLVLAKPTIEGAPSAPPAEQAQLPGAGAKVVAAADSTGAGSALDVFDPRDPFRPPEAVLDAGKPSGSAPAGGGSAESGGSTEPGSPATQDGDGSGSEGTGGGEAPAPTAPTAPTTKTRQYTYVIDVTFTHNDRTRRVKGLQKLDMLPRPSSPLLIFLGVAAGGGNAVFLVDSKLKGAGEGTCKPSGSDCAFLSIGAGSQHQFTDEDGDSYTLRIDQIRKVSVRTLRASKARRGRSRNARAVGARRVSTPVFVDLVDVATTRPGGSSRHRRGR